ncbi:MAG: UDP-N-acetylglucosamine 2-epimerase (non-hydrolyzing) [Verrucomicrobiaceae bacterium]|nr:UDP-N-acetylglucosamine 2-epimerase (non-hydrolyzing) [Verrucomicrobiaceae bacterium]
MKALFCFGTRPELIKVAPLIREFPGLGITPVVANTGQHSDLLKPLFELFQVKPDHDLEVMTHGQTLNGLAARLMERLDPVLVSEKPDVVLVQGDTASALAGAQAAFNRQIPVAHIEAGLRSGNMMSPFPEEMNRRLITQLASLNLAATEHNKNTLLAEGVRSETIQVTGNPVVDALKWTLKHVKPGDAFHDIYARVAGRKMMVVTTHRRENFGETMRLHLRALRKFASNHPEVCVVFPVHPNPNVRSAVADELMGCESVLMCQPLGYADFAHLLSKAWMMVSDSGGIQEEAATLGKPILVLRSNTERPEGVFAGVARLAGDQTENLEQLLESSAHDAAWFAKAATAGAVYGDGTAAQKTAKALLEQFSVEVRLAA